MTTSNTSTKTEEAALDGSDQVAKSQAKLEGLRENGADPFQANWDQSRGIGSDCPSRC